MEERPLAFVDFEYAKDPVTSLPILLGMVVQTPEAVYRYRFDHELPDECPFDFSEHTMVAWHLWAELSCFWVADWEFPEHVIDAAVEFGCAVNFDHPTTKDRIARNLYAATSHYGIEEPYTKDQKERYQKICMSWDGRPMDDALMEKILLYCASDVDMLAKVYEAVQAEPFAEPYRSQRYLHALLRGEHMKVATKVFCRGVPLDAEKHHYLDTNRAGITERLIRFVRKDFPGVLGKSGFLQEGFGNYLKSIGLYDEWPRSPKNKRLLTSRQVLKDQVRYHPDLKPLLDVTSVKGLMSKYRVKLCGDGRARVLPMEFHAVSSRANPNNVRYIMSVPRVFRNLITAPPGKKIVQLDFASMEYGVGAALSGDENKIAAYKQGDVYVAFGVLSGMSLEEAKAKRSILKNCELGMGFGQQAWGLGRTLGIDPRKAQHYIDLQLATFGTYYGWCRDRIKRGGELGYVHTVGGWRMRVEDHTTDNLLQNWQVQAEAQEIFRAAVLELDEAGYAITGLNHDSVLLEMEEDEDPAPAAEIMSDAAEELLGLRLRVDAEVMKPKPSPFWTMVITRLAS